MRRHPTHRCAGTRADAVVRVLAQAAAPALVAATAFADTIVLPTDAEGIVVPLPDAAESRAGSSTIIVELNGYDVTALVTRVENRLELPTRSLDLAPGQYALRLLAANESGDINLLIEHVLEVAANQRSSRRRVNLLLGSSYRVAEESQEDFANVSEDEQRGLLELDAEVRDARFALRTLGGVLYDTVRETSPEDALWQSPAYAIQAERAFDNGVASVTLGDDAVPFGNLLFNSFTRRGVRADASALGDRLQAQVFSLYSDPRTRLDEDVLPSHREERAIGGYTSFSPLPRHAEWLQVTAGYVDGEGTLGGAAINTLDPETIYGGHAWNAAVDSFTLGSSLWLHLEYAESRFDTDGIGRGAPAARDDARQVVLQLGSGGLLSVPGLDEWAIGWQHQVVGQRFFSLGNLMLPGDISVHQGYLRLGWQGLQLGAELVSQHSDIEDDPLRPRHDSIRRSAIASYTPVHIDPQAGVWRLLGTPTLTAEFQHIEFEQADSDALLAGFDLDSRERSGAVGIDFAGSALTFGVRHGETRFDDRSQALVVDDFPIYEPQANTRERTTTVQLAWTPGARFMIAPQFQRSSLTTDGVAGTSRSDLWGLQCQAELVRDVLWLQASYSETGDEPASLDPTLEPEEFSSGGGAASLLYRMRPAGGAWPAIDWHLSGQYATDDLNDTWQVHLGFELSWNSEAE